MRNPLAELGKNVFYIILGVITIAALVAAIIAGVGMLAALATAALVAIVIYFGSIQELAASVVVGALLKAYTSHIRDFATIWWTGSSATAFFKTVDSTGYFMTIAVVFFFAYTTSFFTSRIRIFSVHVKNSVTSKGGNSEE